MSPPLNPKIGGRIYMAWNSGFYAAGEFTLFEPDRRLIFTWYGRNEPAPTLVEVSLTPKGDKTLVQVIHSGLGSGFVWEKMIDEVKQGWPSSLENLASTLESGPDLRFVLRPMLGITVGDFDPEIAARLAVPTDKGIRLDGVLEEMGAYSAGLRRDDVITAMDGQPIVDGETFAAILSGHRAGDKIEVEFYRGAEKIKTLMELSRRPLPEIPTSPACLAEAVSQTYAQLQTQLAELLHGATEAEANFKPDPDAWSVKEILAHLIHGERDGHAYLTEIVGGQVRWADDYAGNLAMRTQATLQALPTLQELLTELKRLFAESIALYQHIPADFPEKRKGTWWGITYYVLSPPYHTQAHFQQIQEAIHVARS